jgi:uncharacterized protein YceK
MENVMFKLRNMVLVVMAITLGGCASELLSSAIAIPGTVVDAVGNVGSSIWNLLTGWIPGSGGETIEVVTTPAVVETTTVEVVE